MREMGVHETLDPQNPGDLPETILSETIEPEKKKGWTRDAATYYAFLLGLAPHDVGMAARERLEPVDKTVERVALGLSGFDESLMGALILLATPHYADPLAETGRELAITYLLFDGAVRGIVGSSGRPVGGAIPSAAKFLYDWARYEIAEYREKRSAKRAGTGAPY